MSNRSKWELTKIDSNHLNRDSIVILLSNRGYHDTKEKTKKDLIRILRENYDVEDDMKPLNQLTIKEIIAELFLRSDANIIDVLTINERIKQLQDYCILFSSYGFLDSSIYFLFDKSSPSLFSEVASDFKWFSQVPDISRQRCR